MSYLPYVWEPEMKSFNKYDARSIQYNRAVYHWYHVVTRAKGARSTCLLQACNCVVQSRACMLILVPCECGGSSTKCQVKILVICYRRRWIIMHKHPIVITHSRTEIILLVATVCCNVTCASSPVSVPVTQQPAEVAPFWVPVLHVFSLLSYFLQIKKACHISQIQISNETARVPHTHTTHAECLQRDTHV